MVFALACSGIYNQKIQIFTNILNLESSACFSPFLSFFFFFFLSYYYYFTSDFTIIDLLFFKYSTISSLSMPSTCKFYKFIQFSIFPQYLMPFSASFNFFYFFSYFWALFFSPFSGHSQIYPHLMILCELFLFILGRPRRARNRTIGNSGHLNLWPGYNYCHHNFSSYYSSSWWLLRLYTCWAVSSSALLRSLEIIYNRSATFYLIKNFDLLLSPNIIEFVLYPFSLWKTLPISKIFLPKLKITKRLPNKKKMGLKLK